MDNTTFFDEIQQLKLNALIGHYNNDKECIKKNVRKGDLTLTLTGCYLNERCTYLKNLGLKTNFVMDHEYDYIVVDLKHTLCINDADFSNELKNLNIQYENAKLETLNKLYEKDKEYIKSEIAKGKDKVALCGDYVDEREQYFIKLGFKASGKGNNKIIISW